MFDLPEHDDRINPRRRCAIIEGNICADPLFVNSAQGDLHLRAGSSAVDAASIPEAPETDCDGRPRPSGPAADMGAYVFAP